MSPLSEAVESSGHGTRSVSARPFVFSQRLRSGEFIDDGNSTTDCGGPPTADDPSLSWSFGLVVNRRTRSGRGGASGDEGHRVTGLDRGSRIGGLDGRLDRRRGRIGLCHRGGMDVSRSAALGRYGDRN